MDSALATAGEVGRHLGVSAPTIRRAAEAEGIIARRTAGGHRRFTPNQVEKLARRLGVTPTVPGLTRHQTQALAAFATHPFGFRSARAVARATRMSPTATGRAIEVLVERGLIRSAVETVAEGHARQLRCWRLEVDEPWFRAATLVAQTVLPDPGSAAPAPSRVPRRFWHLFWDVDPGTLTVAEHGDFIATRLVLGPDLIARSWALRNLPPHALSHAARNRAADPSMQAMIHNATAA